MTIDATTHKPDPKAAIEALHDALYGPDWRSKYGSGLCRLNLEKACGKAIDRLTQEGNKEQANALKTAFESAFPPKAPAATLKIKPIGRQDNVTHLNKDGGGFAIHRPNVWLGGAFTLAGVSLFAHASQRIRDKHDTGRQVTWQDRLYQGAALLSTAAGALYTTIACRGGSIANNGTVTWSRS